MMKKFMILGSLLLMTFSAFAETGPGADTIAEQNALTAKVSTQEPLLLGWKSFNDSGRLQEMDTANGRTLEAKQEIYLGYRMDNGWGGFVQATQYLLQYNNSASNKWAAGDPSVSLIHPDWYNDGALKVTGIARYYIPSTDYSRTLNMREYAYYLTLTDDMGYGQNLFNQLIPRFFADTAHPYASDTTFYIEDRTVYTQKFNSWIRYGIGQWTQYEQHANPTLAPTGLVIEAIPEVDFTLAKNTFVSPRVLLPVLVQNGVYDAPTNASLGQTAFELYFQTSL